MAVQQTVGQRFSQLIQALGMSKNAFALSLDKTATVIQHIVEERNKPGFDLLCKVFEVYPNVSKDWLLQGAGSMFPFAATDAEPATLFTSVAAAVVPTAVVAPVEPKPALPAVPEEQPTVATPAPVAPATPVAVDAPAAPQPAPATSAAPIAPASPVAAPSAPVLGWEAALYAQQLQHQLALAELRNQHLLEQQQQQQEMMEMRSQSLLDQQKLLQQMVDLLRQGR